GEIVFSELGHIKYKHPHKVVVIYYSGEDLIMDPLFLYFLSFKFGVIFFKVVIELTNALIFIEKRRVYVLAELLKLFRGKSLQKLNEITFFHLVLNGF